jgi:DNA-binding response OmpR family regulator
MKTLSRIALIDDDRAWRETLADFLCGKGFDVYPAEDARGGLDLLDRNDIRMAIIDYHMGELDGLALLRRLRMRARRNGVHAQQRQRSNSCLPRAG